jgi:hypothetical protein
MYTNQNMTMVSNLESEKIERLNEAGSYTLVAVWSMGSVRKRAFHNFSNLMDPKNK